MKQILDVSDVAIIDVNNFCMVNDLELEIKQDRSCQITIMEVKLK